MLKRSSGPSRSAIGKNPASPGDGGGGGDRADGVVATASRAPRKGTSTTARAAGRVASGEVVPKVAAKRSATKGTAAEGKAMGTTAARAPAMKKTASKKAPAKKAPAKKAPAKKAPAKKATAKKAPAKKAPAKKAPAKKAPAKKAPAKKAPAKKTASKKTASKKTASKNVVARATAAKKATSKRKASTVAGSLAADESVARETLVGEVVADDGRADEGRTAEVRTDTERADDGAGPRIVPRAEHPVSRRAISRSALKVLDRLHEGGFGAYLVGGGVRDALVGIEPKDFDIATDASPEDVRALFRNSRIIGRRFRLVHVVFGREIIEVATFRAAHDKGEGGEVGASGRIVRDNVFGSIEEDARRRDFSVNALYYNIADRSVVDYVGGLEDIERGVFRLIGDPLTRCEEDPVRVLRAVRLAAKLRFSIDPATLEAMRRTAPELGHTPPARLFEEVLKLFQGGYAERSFAAVVEHDLLPYLFPLLARRLDGADGALRTMLDAALANTDRRVAQGKPITPAYLLAFMLWPDVEERARADCGRGRAVHDALQEAADRVLAQQLRVISIPRRFSAPMKEIWQMQPRLERHRGQRALRLMEDRRFRAAYDFLCLRARVDERLADVARWWTSVQEMPEGKREAAAAARPFAHGVWGDGPDAPDVPDGVPAEDIGFGGTPRGAPSRRRRRGGRDRAAADEGTVVPSAAAGRPIDGPVPGSGEGDGGGRSDRGGPGVSGEMIAGARNGGSGAGADGAATDGGGGAGEGGAAAAQAGDAGASARKRRRRRRRRGGAARDGEVTGASGEGTPSGGEE